MSNRPTLVKITGGEGGVIEGCVAVHAADHVSAALTSEGKVYTWGRADRNVLGHTEGIVDGASKQAVYVPTAIAFKPRVQQLSLGSDHACAVTKEGELYTWGSNKFSQLGLGDSQARTFPTNVPLEGKARYVAAGWRFSMCALENGQLYSWGAASQGQLGHPQQLRQRQPALIESLAAAGIFISKMECGETHVLAMSRQGSIFSWGQGTMGRLGHGSEKSEATPRRIEGPEVGTTFRDIACGFRHSAAIDSRGRLWTWGCGADGRLGNGTTSDVFDLSLPVNLGSGEEEATHVSCGYKHTSVCAGKAIWTFGSRDNGRLGDGVPGRSAPVPVQADLPSSFAVTETACGCNHTLALCHDGRVLVWGAVGSASDYGQHGLGEFSARGRTATSGGGGGGGGAYPGIPPTTAAVTSRASTAKSPSDQEYTDSNIKQRIAEQEAKIAMLEKEIRSPSQYTALPTTGTDSFALSAVALTTASASSRSDLVHQLSESSLAQKRMGQRLKYNRKILLERLRKTCVRYGRDKLCFILALRAKQSMRLSFSRWALQAQAKKRADILRRGKLKLRVGFDQIAMQEEKYDKARFELERARKMFGVFIAFQKWVQHRNKRVHAQELGRIRGERAMLKRELLTIYERMTEMEAAENGSLTTAMQRGASHIANLDKFVDVLEHASSLSSAEAAITIG
eukprot:g1933.t1